MIPSIVIFLLIKQYPGSTRLLIHRWVPKGSKKININISHFTSLSVKLLPFLKAFCFLLQRIFGLKESFSDLWSIFRESQSSVRKCFGSLESFSSLIFYHLYTRLPSRSPFTFPDWQDAAVAWNGIFTVITLHLFIYPAFDRIIPKYQYPDGDSLTADTQVHLRRTVIWIK